MSISNYYTLLPCESSTLKLLKQETYFLFTAYIFTQQLFNSLFNYGNTWVLFSNWTWNITTYKDFFIKSVFVKNTQKLTFIVQNMHCYIKLLSDQQHFSYNVVQINSFHFTSREINNTTKLFHWIKPENKSNLTSWLKLNIEDTSYSWLFL